MRTSFKNQIRKMIEAYAELRIKALLLEEDGLDIKAAEVSEQADQIKQKILNSLDMPEIPFNIKK